MMLSEYNLKVIDLNTLCLDEETSIDSVNSPIVEKSGNTVTYTLPELRKEMKKTIEDFIKGDYKGKVLNMQVPAGAGKSRITTEVINEVIEKGNDVVWFASMHDQFNDFENLRQGKWVHIHGRTEGSDKVPENCKHAKKARLLGGKGYAISHVLCGKICKNIGNCEYWAQINKKGHKFLPHQMLFFFDGKGAPLVVFDELSLKVFIEECELNPSDLINQARLKNTDFWMAFIRLLSRSDELHGQTLYDKLDSMLSGDGTLKEKLERLEFEDSKESGSELDEDEEIPIYGIGQKIKEIMLSEIDLLKRHDSLNSRLIVNPRHYKSNKAVVQIKVRREPPEWLKDKPIILLGAKGAPELFQKVLKKTKKDFINYSRTIKIPKDVEIAKESVAPLPFATLKSIRVRQDAYSEIKKYLDPELEKTCLICHKEFEDDFSQLLKLKYTKYNDGKVSEYHDTGHYWGIRGLNVWKDYDQIILIGTPTPNIDDMVRQVQAIYWENKPLDKTTSKENGFHDYKDKRISWYLHSLREDELYQAIFRIRPLELKSRKKINIIIASALPLQDLDSRISKQFNIQSISTKKKQTKFDTLRSAAVQLLEKQDEFTRNQLVEHANTNHKLINSINLKFVDGNIKDLIKELNLEEVHTCPRKYRRNKNNKLIT
jgi:hypothetical protein